MQETTLSYKTVIQYFGEDTVQSRYRYIYEKMNDYIDKRNIKDILYINEALLHQAILDYFTDVYRLKVFHKIEYINHMKITAYEVYWLLRRKPLQLIKGVDIDNKYVFVNEGFLTTFIEHELLLADPIEPLDKQSSESLLKFMRHIHYHLKYRNVDKQCLELMLYAYKVGNKVPHMDYSEEDIFIGEKEK